MRYATGQLLKDEAFKRSTGVQRNTFEKLLAVVGTRSRVFPLVEIPVRVMVLAPV